MNDDGTAARHRAQADLRDDELTEAVAASFDGSGRERYRELMQSLVRHLHAFIAEVGLTEQEWADGIDFLTRTGHITDERRQEFILLSDVLGASMLVVGINHPAGTQATESTVFGPFFVEGSPRIESGENIADGAPGRPCYMEGRILSETGDPIPGARLEVWLADDEGLYDVQYDGDQVRNRGHLFADDEGRFRFWAVLPKAYPIPDDGPVGELLKAAGRHPMRPAHVHFMAAAEGYESLTTHVFVAGDEYLDSDAVFGVKSSLVAPFSEHDPGTGPAPDSRGEPYYAMSYDLVLKPLA
jgi:hydroxyquinol 1,2-dioxygenase